MPSKHITSPIRVNFVALGCPKNLVDSEKMLGLLTEAGILLVGADGPADATIINTCGFIADARDEAFENIDLALEQKRNGQVRKVIVAGCLAQYWGDKLLARNDQIDAVVGLGQRDNIASIVKELVSTPQTEQGQLHVANATTASDSNDQVRLRLTEPSWAYLRISEGCDQACTFCAIPTIRGRFRSKSPDAIMAEARELVADGALELNLIGQETTSYGRDIGYAGGLADLLRELNELDSLRWMRLLYAHPATMNDEHIAAMAQCDKVVPYLDIPLQHINDRILGLMRRRITRARTEALVSKLRESLPSLAIRTTMLVGFPSESPGEFEELLQFVEATRFDALGVFTYSAEEGTPAAEMPGSIAEDLKHQRRERLMLAQQRIAFELADGYRGRKVQCLVLSEADDAEASHLRRGRKQHLLVGRHQRQAPEIDGFCYIRAHAQSDIKPGRIVPVRVTGRDQYDLVCEV